MTGQTWWYVARAGGIIAWVLLAASVLWGLALSTKALGKRPRPNWLLDLHRFLGGLALVFTAVHITALVADSYTHFGVAEILVPLTGSYRPSAVAWGVVGLYLLVAVELTSLLRSRLPKELWRRIHFASFPLFAFATVHGLLAGTDATGRVMFATMIGASLAVAGLTVVRIVQASAPPPAPVPRRQRSVPSSSASRGVVYRSAVSSPRSREPKPASWASRSFGPRS